MSAGFVAAEPLPLGVDVGLSVPNLLVGVLGLAVALLAAVRFGSKVSVLAGLGGAFYLVSEMVWLGYLYATRPGLAGAAARRSAALLNVSNAAIAGLQIAGMALLVLAVAAAGAHRRGRRVVVTV